jgi:hypothetical protein
MFRATGGDGSERERAIEIGKGAFAFSANRSDLAERSLNVGVMRTQQFSAAKVLERSGGRVTTGTTTV